MLSLGYDKYGRHVQLVCRHRLTTFATVTQGGDWGFYVGGLSNACLDLNFKITRRIAMDYGGKHSMAWHTNFALYESFTYFHLLTNGMS